MDMDQNGYVGPLYGAPGLQFDTYQDVDPSSGGIQQIIGQRPQLLSPSEAYEVNCRPLQLQEREKATHFWDVSIR